MADESENLPLESIQRIDQLCDQYEEQWDPQRHTELEGYLKQVTNAERQALLKALLKVELELQKVEGLEQLSQELPKRFPDYQSTITQLITAASQKVKTEEEDLVGQPDASTNTDPKDETGTDFPQKIERFEIKEVLGEGGFGTVYMAFDPNLNRTIALKVPLPSTLKSKENLDRFVREAQIAASLYHPGICPIYDVDQQGTLPFIVMKYIEGSTMDEIFKRQNTNNRLMPIPKTVQLIQKIGEAIEYAHEKGIIHRDLKPSNIIWDKEHKIPVITDFGLARFWNSNESELTVTGQTMGTPAYIAPEQALGKSKDLGRQVDVYSLGVILYEVLTGTRPFPGNSYDVVIQKSSEDPPAPSKHRMEIDAHLDAICLKAIAREPQQRYETVQELLNALRKYTSSEDVSPASQVLNVPEEDSELKPISQTAQQKRSAEKTTKTSQPQKRKIVELDPNYDPYYLWLGIPKENRPAAYHELLGVGRKEDDDQVITSAAKRQSAIVEPYLATEYEGLARQLLYELSEAKTVLSDPYLRMEYRKSLPKPQKHKPGYRGVGIPSDDTPHQPVGEGSEFLRVYMGVMGCISFLILLAFVVSAYAPIWNNDEPDQEAVVELKEEPNNPKQKDDVAQKAPDENEKDPEEEKKPVAPIIGPDGWIDLLANFDLSKQRLDGDWEFKNSFLASVDQNASAAVRFPFVEQSNYELEITFSFSDARSPKKRDGIHLVIPVGEKRVRLGIYNDWVALAGLAFNPNQLNFRTELVPPENYWRCYFQDIRQGRYNPAVNTIGLNRDRGGRKLNYKKAEQIKLNLSVVSKEDQYRIVVFLNEHLFVDQSFSQSQLTEMDIPEYVLKRHLLKKIQQAIILVCGEKVGRRASFSSIRYKPGKLDSEIIIPEPDPPQITETNKLIVKELFTLKGHTYRVRSVAFSPSGKSLVSGSWDKTTRVWDSYTGNERYSLKEKHGDWVHCVVASSDGKIIVTATGGGRGSQPTAQERNTIKIWDIDSRKLVHELSGHADKAMSVAISPTEEQIVTASLDGTAKIWNLKSRKLKQTLRGHQGTVHDAQYSPDGNQIATSGSKKDKTIRIWDARSGKELYKTNNECVFTSIRYTRNGKYIVGGASDSGNAPYSVHVWDANTLKLVNTFGKHKRTIFSVAISPDDKWIATGSLDKTAKLWDLETGQELATMEGHSESVISVAFGPEGHRLATASNDHTVKVWQLSSSGELTPSIDKDYKPPSMQRPETAIAPTKPITLIPAKNILDQFVPFFDLKAKKDTYQNKYPYRVALSRKNDELSIVKLYSTLMVTKQEYKDYRLEVLYLWEKANYAKREQYWSNSIWFNVLMPLNEIPEDVLDYRIDDFSTRFMKGYHARLTPFSRKGFPYTLCGQFVSRRVRIKKLFDFKQKGTVRENGEEPFYERPPGKTNKLEITSYRGNVEVQLNGKTTFKGKNAESLFGRFAIQTAKPTFTIKKMIIHPYDGPRTETEE